MVIAIATLSWRADAATDAVASVIRDAALRGGVSAADVFNRPGFFDAARACFGRSSAASTPDQVEAQQKRCLAAWMGKHGAPARAIAFMRVAPAPAAISAVRDYGPVAVVRAAMLWADASEGWAIVGRAGDVVPLWRPPDVEAEPSFRNFVTAHPGTALWATSVTWPQVAALPDDARELNFGFALKTCHACADVGMATIAYRFDAAGNLLNARLVRIIPKSAAS